MGDMSKTSAEKLNGLFTISGKRKVDAATVAGITPNAMSRYLSGTSPSASVVVKLAVFFGVDPVWLADEDQPWIDPPPRPGAMLSNEALMDEVRHRYLHLAAEARELIEEAEAIDWEYIAAGFADGKVGNGRDDINAGAEVARMLWRLPVTLAQFDTGYVLPWNRAWRQDREIDRDSFKFYDLDRRVQDILSKLTQAEESRAAFHTFISQIDRAWKTISIPGRLRRALEAYHTAGGRYV